ncbi:hypothetical protein QBC41DRAFT_348197 [Cercophora samala]|uniref:Uncharacterized protein n=1 Tax=Cercophora samala TaxID=330535 RepID=A0AA39ZA82_9PEZI|nr:hypothetical protein QBC41DRAFT_348197 [Cercophora samala]
MLRRPLTTLTITPEDIADYEDRLAEKHRIQARFVARRDREERRSLGVPAPPAPETRRRIIPSSSPSPPPPQQRHQQHQQHHHQPSESEEEEVSYYARAQQQARQVSLSFQGQQTPMQGGGAGDGQEDEDVEMMSAPPLPPSTGVPQTRAQARMGMVGGGEMETPSGVRGGQPVRRSTRERSREVELMGPPPVMGGRLRGGVGGRGRGAGQGGMEMVTPETRMGGRSREERIGAAAPAPPQAPRRGRRGE